jgi:hypothetical protein
MAMKLQQCGRPAARQGRVAQKHDGYDRLGLVHEAGGENRQAADCYRKVIEFIREAHRRLRPRLRGHVQQTRQSARLASRHLIVAPPLAHREGAKPATITNHPQVARASHSTCGGGI